MTERTIERPRPPPRWRLGAYIAMALELGIVITFFAKQSAFGLLLCAGYAWFSATRSMLSSPPPDD